MWRGACKDTEEEHNWTAVQVPTSPGMRKECRWRELSTKSLSTERKWAGRASSYPGTNSPGLWPLYGVIWFNVTVRIRPRECCFGFFLRYLIACWEQRLLRKQVYACTEKQFPVEIKWLNVALAAYQIETSPVPLAFHPAPHSYVLFLLGCCSTITEPKLQPQYEHFAQLFQELKTDDSYCLSQQKQDEMIWLCSQTRSVIS